MAWPRASPCPLGWVLALRLAPCALRPASPELAAAEAAQATAALAAHATAPLAAGAGPAAAQCVAASAASSASSKWKELKGRRRTDGS